MIQILIQIIAQIQADGGIAVSPNWFFGSLITIMLLFIAFLLKRSIKAMDDMLMRHDAQLMDHETRISVTESRDENIASKVADQIWTKLRAITP